MTQSELNKVLEQHKLWLDSNFKEGTRLDLMGLNLKGLNFIDIDLRFARFAFVNLEDVDLSGAILRDADLFCATLRGCNLTNVDLTCTNITEANLEKNNLEGTGIRFFKGPRHDAIYNLKDDKLYIGCQAHCLDYWLENHVTIGRRHGYTDEEIEVYGNWFKSLKEPNK